LSAILSADNLPEGEYQSLVRTIIAMILKLASLKPCSIAATKLVIFHDYLSFCCFNYTLILTLYFCI
jgi:hypothetical protein